MHIGLIGGIGVAATVVYYQRLTAAVTAMGGRLQLTIAHAEVTDLARNANAGNTAEQADIYAGLIDRLARAGCDCAAITSLGGHFCFEDTVARSALPLVSAVAPLDDHFASRGVGTVGLLGTSVLMRSQLFGQLSLTRAIVPDNLDLVGEAYQAMAIRGSSTKEDGRLFIEEGAELARRGADAVVLAGTDLNLVFDEAKTGYTVIDALDVHVNLLARIATGQAELEAVT